MTVTFFFFDIRPKTPLLLLLPLLLMVLGLIVYLGGFMLLAGVNTMTKEERSRYNMNEITSFAGVFLVLLSYIAYLMMISIMFFAVFIIATFAMIVYVNTSKRFRADTPAEP